MAEREGFEPPEPFGSTVFKTAAIDRSAISPCVRVQSKRLRRTKARILFLGKSRLEAAGTPRIIVDRYGKPRKLTRGSDFAF